MLLSPCSKPPLPEPQLRPLYLSSSSCTHGPSTVMSETDQGAHKHEHVRAAAEPWHAWQNMIGRAPGGQ